MTLDMSRLSTSKFVTGMSHKLQSALTEGANMSRRCQHLVRHVFRTAAQPHGMVIHGTALPWLFF